MSLRTQRTSSPELLIGGITLLSIPFLSILISTLIFMLGGCIAPWIFPVAVVTSFIGGHIYAHSRHDSELSTVRYYLYTLSALTFALLSSAIIYDHSFDGNTYHQGAIVGMTQGWNPFHNPAQTGNIWETHYAKALEIAAATVTMATRRIECGKTVNILLIISSVFITYHFIRNELPKSRRSKIILLTALLSLCPVVVRQAYTYYNDFALYTFMLLSIITLIHIKREKSNPLWWYLIITSALLAAITKFTIAFYLFLTLAIAIVWIFTTGQRTLGYRLIITSVLLFVVSFGIIGFHPYLTNTIGWGNPFYPLMGSNIDIMTSNTPELYQAGNRFSNWLRSLFYNAEGSGVWIPFINDSLHDYYIAYDARIAGLGPLFAYALIISITLFASICFNKRLNRNDTSSQRKSVAIMSLLLIDGCFIFEQSWWIRYVPFLWAVPVILLLYTEYLHLTPLLRTIRNIVYIMLTVTILMCCAASLVGGLAFTQRLGAIYHAVTAQSTVEIYSYGNIISFEHKLHERNIDFRRLTSENSPSDSTLICVPFHGKADIYLDPQTYSLLPHPDLMDYIHSNK